MNVAVALVIFYKPEISDEQLTEIEVQVSHKVVMFFSERKC